MHLLVITPYYQPAWFYGGPSRCIAEQAEILAEQFGYQIDVITLNQNGNIKLFDTNEVVVKKQGNITIHYLPSKLNLLSKKYFYSSYLSNYIKRFSKVDVVHVNTLFNYFSRIGMQFALENKLPYIITPHGMLDKYSLSRSSQIKKLHRLFWDTKLINHARFLQFTTQSEWDNSKYNWTTEPVIVPIVLKLSESPKVSTSSVNDGKLKLVYLSRINRKKGLDLLVNAMASIKRKGEIKFQFDIYGADDDSFQMEIEQLINHSGLQDSISFKGLLPPEKRNEVLQQYDLLVLTSHQENFGLCVVEALENKVPVLISNKVNLNDFVNDHKCGLVCELNVISIEEKLTSFYNLSIEERKKLGEHGRQAVIDFLDPKVIAKQYDDVYRKCVTQI